MLPIMWRFSTVPERVALWASSPSGVRKLQAHTHGISICFQQKIYTPSDVIPQSYVFSGLDTNYLPLFTPIFRRSHIAKG